MWIDEACGLCADMSSRPLTLAKSNPVRSALFVFAYRYTHIPIKSHINPPGHHTHLPRPSSPTALSEGVLRPLRGAREGVLAKRESRQNRRRRLQAAVGTKAWGRVAEGGALAPRPEGGLSRAGGGGGCRGRGGGDRGACTRGGGDEGGDGRDINEEEDARGRDEDVNDYIVL